VQRRFKEGVSKGEDTNRPGLLASAEGGGSYTVVKGDNLWTIAKRMGVKLEDLVADNNIRNPRMIQPGQVLQLRTEAAPAAEAAPPPAAAPGPNYVRQGIQARAGQGPRSFPQLAGELYDGFGNNPRNQETLESGGAFAGAVLGGATGAAVIPRLGGLLGGRAPAMDPRQLELMRDRMTLSPSTVRYRR
jgi:LysM repeat protein